MAILEPKQTEIHGGEYHAVKIDLDENGYLQLKIDANCYGAHAYAFEMLLPCVGPDELERFTKELLTVVEEMRVKDAQTP